MKNKRYFVEQVSFFLEICYSYFGEENMDLYYQNETLYVEILEDLDEQKYHYFRNKVFRIIEDYGVDRIVIQNHFRIYQNHHYLKQLKQDFMQKYHGDLLIR